MHITVSTHPKLQRLPRHHDEKRLQATQVSEGWQEQDFTLEDFAKYIKQGKGFGPIYRDGKRGKDSFSEIHYIALDFDDCVSLADIENHPFINRFTYIAGPTASHTEEKPRTRVVFPLVQPIDDRELFTRLVERIFNQVSELKPDESSKQAERFYFGCQDAIVHHGELLSVGQILDLPIPEPKPRLQPANLNGTQQQRYIAAGIDREIELFKNAQKGERNEQLFKSSAAIGNLFATGDSPYHMAEITNRLIDASYTNGLSHSDGEHATQITIKNGLKAGLETPRDLTHVGTRQNRELSELATAEMVFSEYGSDLMYVPAFRNSGWYVWNGFMWEHDPHRLKVKVFVKKVIRSLYHVAAQEHSENKQKAIHSHIQRCLTERGLNSIINLTGDLVAVDANRLDQRRDLIATPNGFVIDLKSGQPIEPDKQDYITKYIGADYDPDATFDLGLKTITEIMNNRPEMVEFMQRLIGYILTGETREQIYAVFYGEGSNGKSTLVMLIHWLLGSMLSQKSDFSTFAKGIRRPGQARPDLATLAGKRFVFASEGDSQVHLNEAQLKDMVSSEPIEARALYQDTFSYEPMFKIVLSSNHPPIITDTSYGMQRRTRFIPFHRCFSEVEQDKNLLNKLRDELSGFLNWVIQGSVKWYASGLCEPELVMDATKAYLDEQNSLVQFIEDQCAKGEFDRVLLQDFYTQYSLFCDRYQFTPVGYRSIGNELRKLGYTIKRSTGGKRVIEGLSVI